MSYNKIFNKNQKGFSGLEALLIMIIVCLVGFVGWYVWNSNDKANKLTSTKPVVSTGTKHSKNDPYKGWNTGKLEREGLSFKYPSNWTVTTNNVTKGDCYPHGSGCVLDDADSSTLKGPDGFSLQISTDPLVDTASMDINDPTKCLAGRPSCKQYYSVPIKVASKKVFFTITGSKSVDGAGKTFEDNRVGIASNADCLDACSYGLGKAKNLPGYIYISGGYIEKHNLDMQNLKNDQNVIIAKKISASLSY
jgi:hypothetical protein